MKLDRTTTPLPPISRNGNKILTKPREIAQSMNKQFISTIRETISQIPPTNQDPLILYSNYVGPIEAKFNVEQVSMYQLEQVISHMKPSASAASDFISMRLIKEGGRAINPLLLHLTNQIIKN